MNGVLGHIWDKLGQENTPRMVKWMRWHCPPNIGFEIRALTVWGRARHLSITETPHNIESLRVRGGGGRKNSLFETWRPEWGSNRWSPTFQTGSFNHCTRAPAQLYVGSAWSSTMWSPPRCQYVIAEPLGDIKGNTLATRCLPGNFLSTKLSAINPQLGLYLVSH